MRETAVQTALVTGAGRRIGRAIALELGRRRWRIGVHYHRSEADAEAVCDTIRSLGGDAVALPCDLSREDDVSGLVPRCAEALGAPTCLVNNASEFLLDTIETMSATSWNLHMNVNLRAPIVLARAMAAGLPAGAEGNVINIVDQRVWRLTPEFFSYTLSKSALWTATRTMAQALAPRVRVNAIGLGPVLRSVHQTEAEFAEECRATLLERGTSPEEVASTVAYILATTAMTGQMIALDGGQHLMWNDGQA